MPQDEPSLRPKDPNLAAVLDATGERNLLEDASPLRIDTRAGKPVRVKVKIKNGPEGLINLDISSDQPWLQPESEHLSICGGDSHDCILRAIPSGDGEYANMLLKWAGDKTTYQRSCLFQRVSGGEARDPRLVPTAKRGLGDILSSFWTQIPLAIGVGALGLAWATGFTSRPLIFVGVSALFFTLGSIIHRVLMDIGSSEDEKGA